MRESAHLKARSEAASWHAKLGDELATEQDWLAFEQWLDVPMNQAAYDALEQALQVVDANRGEIAAHLAQRPGPRPGPRMAIWTAAIVSAAAAVAMIFLLSPGPPQQFAYAAPAAETRTIILPDSSVIQLNRGAVVNVSWGQTRRSISLERGEAAFQVQHDPNRPFVVVAGGVEVRDVGTEFNVARAGTSLLVTVREGEVAIVPQAGQSVTVAAGAQARVVAGNVVVAPVDPESFFAWRTGRLIYRDASLTTIAEDLSRYSEEPIVVGDDRARALRFTGVLMIDTPDAMVGSLEAFLPIQSEQDAERIVLRSRR